ncbi:hypothetical protein OIU77_018863 [Salix suchowensis]|uniref:Uncharacterized protein n=1 Tax=Salix suchowensis TaxID=1278906 RepID=A0ABQ9CI34_9ROSI|nr:hypothetical protein OIU77_018863 [Salix suchowensis]
MIPVLANALGGILVGLVTSYAGGVRKGFVIVSALLVTALLQFLFEGKAPSIYCLVALPLVMSSISIYQKYPYQAVFIRDQLNSILIPIKRKRTALENEYFLVARVNLVCSSLTLVVEVQIQFKKLGRAMSKLAPFARVYLTNQSLLL